MGDEKLFHNVRDFLGPIIGKRILDITQHDSGEFPCVVLMIEGGVYLRFPIDSAFSYECMEDAA